MDAVSSHSLHLHLFGNGRLYFITAVLKKKIAAIKTANRERFRRINENTAERKELKRGKGPSIRTKCR